MIQVDVFWAYAFGASFAAAASKQLAKEPNFFANAFYAYCVTFLGVIFGPSGVYLLWAHQGWESMQFFGDGETISPLLPTLFASTNVALGVLGFYNAYSCIRAGDVLRAHTHWIVAYFAFALILGFGYRRFLYNGTAEQFQAGEHVDMIDWFGGRVFKALLAMGVILLPAYFVPMAAWIGESLPTAASKQAVLRHMASLVARLWALVCVTFVLGVPTLDALVGTGLTTYLVDGWASWFAPLVGFTIATVFVFAVVSIPFHVAKSSTTTTTTTTSSTTTTTSSRSRSRSPARKQK